MKDTTVTRFNDMILFIVPQRATTLYLVQITVYTMFVITLYLTLHVNPLSVKTIQSFSKIAP
jgi:hypothetical protein